ncbi:Rho guanyl nucleotide exchange factor [Balamuthia mandrillaris]
MEEKAELEAREVVGVGGEGGGEKRERRKSISKKKKVKKKGSSVTEAAEEEGSAAVRQGKKAAVQSMKSLRSVDLLHSSSSDSEEESSSSSDENEEQTKEAEPKEKKDKQKKEKGEAEDRESSSSRGGSGVIIKEKKEKKEKKPKRKGSTISNLKSYSFGRKGGSALLLRNPPPTSSSSSDSLLSKLAGKENGKEEKGGETASTADRKARKRSCTFEHSEDQLVQQRGSDPPPGEENSFKPPTAVSDRITERRGKVPTVIPPPLPIPTNGLSPRVSPRSGAAGSDGLSATASASSIPVVVSSSSSSAFSDGGGGSTIMIPAGKKSSKTDNLSRWSSFKNVSSFKVFKNKEKGGSQEEFTIEAKANPLVDIHRKRKEELAKQEKEILSEDPSLPDTQRHRHKIINEIINTERDYIKDLQNLIHYFMEPLESNKILSSEEIKVIFSNVTMIVKINLALYDDLLAKAKESKGDDLGQPFLNLSDYLKMYSQYCSNQKMQRETLLACEKKNKEFKAFLESRHHEPELCYLQLTDFLIKPVQRLCKYPLLLRELLRHTDKAHADYSALESAYQKIQNVVTSVNTQKQNEEDLEKVAELLNILQGTEKFGVQLMVPGRRFIEEGFIEQAIKSGTGVCEFQTMRYYLFSDLLILCESSASAQAQSEEKKVGKHSKGKKNKEKVNVLAMVPFAMSLVNDVADNAEKKVSNAVEIIYKKDIITLRFASSEEKARWMTQLLTMERLDLDDSDSGSDSDSGETEPTSEAFSPRARGSRVTLYRHNTKKQAPPMVPSPASKPALRRARSFTNTQSSNNNFITRNGL